MKRKENKSSPPSSILTITILGTCLLLTLSYQLLTTPSYSKLGWFRQFRLSNPNVYCSTTLLANQN